MGKKLALREHSHMYPAPLYTINFGKKIRPTFDIKSPEIIKKFKLHWIHTLSVPNMSMINTVYIFMCL